MAKKVGLPKFRKVKTREDNKGSKNHEMLENEEYVFDREIEFSEEELPEIKNWEVGKEYTLELKVKQVSAVQKDGKKMKANFLVKQVKSK